MILGQQLANFDPESQNFIYYLLLRQESSAKILSLTCDAVFGLVDFGIAIHELHSSNQQQNLRFKMSL